MEASILGKIGRTNTPMQKELVCIINLKIGLAKQTLACWMF
jgi:hypothetical protein